MKCMVNDDVVLSRPLEGPLSTYIPGFAQWTREEGYAFSSRHKKVYLAACFSRWLGQQAVNVRHVSPERAARYQRSHPRQVQTRRGDAATLRQLLDFLNRQHVLRGKKIPRPRLTPIGQIVQAFEGYLRKERVLSELSVVRYVPFVREFLADRFGDGPVKLSRLCAGDVARFVRRQAPCLHLKTAKLLTTALRSFLHYARYLGQIGCDLAAAVPTVANWSMPSIPRAIPADAVRQLLASINRRTATGCRDYAILLLLARLECWIVNCSRKRRPARCPSVACRRWLRHRYVPATRTTAEQLSSRFFTNPSSLPWPPRLCGYFSNRSV